MAVVKIDWNPTPKMLRVFGLTGLVVFLLLAGIVFRFHRFMFWSIAPGAVTPLAAIFGVLGVYCGVCAAAATKALKPLYLFMTVAFYPIGLVMGYVVMAVIFYLVITPIGIIFKLIGRDAMNRRFDRAAATYWIERRPASVKRYLRQF